MTETELKPGLRHSKTLVVDASLTVPQVSPAFDFSDMPAVFATAFMVALVEATCLEAVKPYLADNQRTVGIHIDMGHSAATPIGMKVTAEVELVEVDGRRLIFQVECRDEKEVIGAGHHERFIVDLPKFLARVDAKAASAGA
jgi:fluoroacetyl-CoA thioesterase